MLDKIFSENAPAAIGPYSQAIKAENTVYLSGQIPLDPKTMQLISADFKLQATQVFENMKAVSIAAGGSLAHIAKLTIFLTNLNDFNELNDVMKNYFQEPYPARSTFQVSALPKEARVEIEAIMILS